MFCINCGAENEDGSVFCMSCGAKLDAPATPTPTPDQGTFAAPDKTIAQPKVAQAAPVTPVEPNVATQTQVQPPKQEGCLSAAWHDITSTKGWFKKVLFMALCNLVPFMNFGTIGYAQQWGVDAAKGNRETLPQKIFSNKTFLTGGIEFVTWTAQGFVYVVLSIIVTCLLFGIPFLGFIIGLAVTVFGWFWNSFITLSSMRGALKFDLGEGFQIKKITNVFKRNVGGAFCAYFVPSILCGLICGLIIFIFVCIFIGALTPVIMSLGSIFSGNSSSSSNPLAMYNNIMNIFSMIGTIFSIGTVAVVIVVLIIAFITCFMGAFEKLLRYRAMGHWIARFAPEWINEENEPSVQKE